jgi:hypothetical protein
VPPSPLRLAIGGSLLLPALACGPSVRTPDATSPAGTASAITAADLRGRLYAYADDSMQGRRSGLPGNVKATDYIAAEAQRLGLEPAGERGSYFQTVPMVQRTLDPQTALTVEGVTLRSGTDFLPRDQGKGARSLDGVSVVYGGVLGDDANPMISREAAAGKLVVLKAAPDSTGAPAGTVNRAATTERFSSAAGIAVATLDAIQPSEQAALLETGAQLATDSDVAETPSFMYVTSRAAVALLGAPATTPPPGAAGRTVHGIMRFVDSTAPSPARNVVALLRGSDPTLRGQMVAVGAHNDHDGFAPEAVDHDSLRAFNRLMRPEGANSSPGQPTAEQTRRIAAILDSLRRQRGPRTDSVFNGADDDGTGTVGVLEIAELLATGTRPKRSVLFVWHTAEELGLLGADWFTRHPTVPRDSIVAQLNIDMIGRGGPGDIAKGGPAYIQMIGSRRLSTELGNLVERVNRDGKHGFEFDYSFDADGHPDNYYCRSDHYMYARFGIPIAFFSTGSHLDYHQVTDEPQYIDYSKLERVTKLVAEATVAVGNLDHRIVVDKPKPDPEAPCKQ